MRSTLFLSVAILLVLGIFFARDRLRLAFQVGAVLYAIVLVARFAIYSSTDPDTLLELAAILGIFGLVWLVFWGLTQAILRYRARSRSPRR
jgi:hypothetical protein